MEIITITQFVLFGLCIISGFTILIFILRKNDKGLDYTRIIRNLNKQKEKDLNILSINNREIIESSQKYWNAKKNLIWNYLINNQSYARNTKIRHFIDSL